MPSQGPFPPTIGQDITGVGTKVWGTPTNIFTSNDQWSICPNGPGGVSHYLRATGFGFSIPVDSIIDGITTTIEKSISFDFGGEIDDNIVQLCSAGVQIGDNKAEVGGWIAVDAVTTYGGSSDLWGNVLTVSIVNASSFGFSVSSKEILGASIRSRVDQMTMTVSYHIPPPSLLYPFWFFN